MSRIAASTDAFYAIADATRRHMLDSLRLGEQTASALGADIELAQPTISKHLRVLRDAGLVRVRRNGQQRIYSLAPDEFRPIFDWVGHYEQFWPKKLGSLGDYLASKPE